MLQLIWQIMSQYGIVSGLVIVALIIIIKYFAAHYKVNNGSESSDKDTITPKFDSVSPLKSHSFFTNIRYRKNLEIPSLIINSQKPVRQQVFRDLIVTLLTSLENSCMEIARMEAEMKGWSSDKWVATVSNKITDSFNDFSTTAKDKGIPPIVLEKFSNWHQGTVEVLFEYILNIGNSNLFQSNIARTNTLFFILNLLVVTTIADAEKTLRCLNGQLAGKMYGNMVIEE